MTIMIHKLKIFHHVLPRQCGLWLAGVILHSKTGACVKELACNPAKREMQLSSIWSKGLVLFLWGFTIQKGTNFIKCDRRTTATTLYQARGRFVNFTHIYWRDLLNEKASSHNLVADLVCSWVRALVVERL